MFYVIGGDGVYRGPLDVGALEVWAADGRVVASTVLKDCETGEEYQASSFLSFKPADTGPKPGIIPTSVSLPADAAAAAPQSTLIQTGNGFPGCYQCAKPPEVGPYNLPLCTACRDQLSRRPMPAWIVVSGMLVGLAVVIALIQLPGVIGADMAYARGRRAEQARNYPRAETEYQKVVNEFPDSYRALSRLAIASYFAHDEVKARTVLSRIETVDEKDSVYAPRETALEMAVVRAGLHVQN